MTDLKTVQPRPGKIARKQAGKSGIGYPYYNLEDSIEVAKAVWNRGGGTCAPDAMATYLHYSTTKSGAYLTRMSAAKMFGLIETQRGRISVTERAKAIISPVMPEDARQAKVDAFMGVPLFKAIFDRFKGKTIPQEMGLRNLLQNEFHIVPDRVAPAYKVLMASAEFAGFFETSGDKTKLIAPVLSANDTPRPDNKTVATDNQEPPVDARKKSGGDDGNLPPPGVHTAIIGLLRELPAAGTVWPLAKKDRFMQAFKSTIDFIYPEEE